MEKLGKAFDDLLRFLNLNIIQRIAINPLFSILDIIFLSVLLYFVIKFFIDRRAAQLFYGLVIITSIYILSITLNMTAINMIFKQFYQYGVIVIVLMFQPEIRSGLEKIGSFAKITNFIGLSNHNKSSSFVNNSIDIIAKTAIDLSNDKTGALMIIERDTKLGEYIKTGTLINAQLTPQLLKNIFFNKAPLHDGAVILRAFRIYSAGCYLPLSNQDNIDENMGTRHRAGIGISEVSDAVVVIVSEETGKISIAVNGNITQGYNHRTLKKELAKLLITNNNPKATKNNLSNDEIKEEV